MATLFPFIKDQIEAQDIVPHRPLIICDVDEVLVYFAQPLAAYFAEHGYHLSFHTYSIFNNVTCQQSGKPLEKEKALFYIDQFFAEKVATCPVVEGAVDALAKLADQCQIILYSNVPLEAKNQRAEALKAQGLPYPLISGKGLKGPAVQHMLQDYQATSFFIDDLPHNIDSVKSHHSAVNCIHYVADDHLKTVVPKPQKNHHWLESWQDIHHFIQSSLTP